MSALDQARLRFQRRAQEQPALALSPKQDQRLADALDRSIVRTWYRISKPGQGPIEVAFNPELTLPEAQARYPDCAVTVP